MEINIYYKFSNGLEGILDNGYNLKGITNKKEGLEYAKQNINLEQLQDTLVKEFKSTGIPVDLATTEIELVTSVKGRWVTGFYTDHETDTDYKSRRRKITYSNGFVEYEVDTPHYGIEKWDSPDHSGYGDTFELALYF